MSFVVAVAGVSLAGPAAASGGKRSAKACSTSATPTATKYNRTPAGSGPWRVPLDPCNYEARANGFTSVHYDDCVYWAAEKRPDVFYGAVNKYGYKVAPYGAWNVAIDAKKAGYSVTRAPKVGDIAAWKPNALMGRTADSWYNASSGGHVAYVEAVSGSLIRISDMGSVGADGGYTFDLAYSPATHFIHKKRS
jgi:surface antigen